MGYEAKDSAALDMAQNILAPTLEAVERSYANENATKDQRETFSRFAATLRRLKPEDDLHEVKRAAGLAASNLEALQHTNMSSKARIALELAISSARAVEALAQVERDEKLYQVYGQSRPADREKYIKQAKDAWAAVQAA